jgi:hypothetical protein
MNRLCADSSIANYLLQNLLEGHSSQGNICASLHFTARATKMWIGGACTAGLANDQQVTRDCPSLHLWRL